ncbi:MAG: protein-tyrosine phosphatase family protein [Acidobacteriota bacterium]
MQVRVYWIETIDRARLGIMPRPRGGDWLEDEIASLSEQNVNAVVSLLTEEEMIELDLVDEPEFCKRKGIGYFSLPIQDRNVPPLNPKTIDFIFKLREILSDGLSIVIHCRQGIGRASLIAASILVTTGTPVDIAFQQISKARGCTVPETEEQYQWVIHFISEYAGLDSPLKKADESIEKE